MFALPADKSVSKRLPLFEIWLNWKKQETLAPSERAPGGQHKTHGLATRIIGPSQSYQYCLLSVAIIASVPSVFVPARVCESAIERERECDWIPSFVIILSPSSTIFDHLDRHQTNKTSVLDENRLKANQIRSTNSYSIHNTQWTHQRRATAARSGVRFRLRTVFEP